MNSKHGVKVFNIDIAGLICLVVWVLTLQIPEVFIYRLLRDFSNRGEEQLLFSAAATLVALNTIRAIPLYLGCFYLAEGMRRYGRMLPMIMIPFSYYLVELFSGERSHFFGMSAVMGIFIVFLLQLLIRNVQGRFNRSVALSLFVFSFQWLNTAPLLTQYGFGQGELSFAIKNIAIFSSLSNFLDFLGLGGFLIAFIGAMMATALLININLNSRQFWQLMEQNKALAVMREDTLRARMTHEIQSLVHDLRRPLTSIQGLADVLAVVSETSNTRRYAKRIAADTEIMVRMVGEILHEDRRNPIDAREVLDYAMSQTSPFPWHRYMQVQADREAENLKFSGNKIRISRALVNLMENAAHAVRKNIDPRISIKYFLEGNFIKFSILDNGPGVPDGLSIGSSGHGSTGLGLALVRSVAENHGGSFVLRNAPTGGAEAMLSLSLNGNEK